MEKIDRITNNEIEKLRLKFQDEAVPLRDTFNN